MRPSIKHSGVACRLPTMEDAKGILGESKVSTNLVYSLPEKLVDCLKNDDPVPSLLSDPAVLREEKFAGLAKPGDWVGFRMNDEKPITVVDFRFLDEAPGAVTAEFLRLAGSQFPVKAAEEYNNAIEPNYRYAQGYCGWLLQQDEYWRDLNCVVDLLGDRLNGGLLPQQVFTSPSNAELVQDDDAKTASAFKAFCEKWRLQGMATLDLPMVVEPQLTSVTVYAPNSPSTSVSPHIPDIFPIDAKGPIASALESARMAIESPHLEEWKGIIGTKSRRKKKVDRFARHFCLQHYWRVLLHRYPGQLHKRKSVLEETFAKYFGVDSTVIRRDSQEMSILMDRNLSTFL